MRAIGNGIAMEVVQGKMMRLRADDRSDIITEILNAGALVGVKRGKLPGWRNEEFWGDLQ